MPIVSIIMPHISTMSRDSVWNMSALVWHFIGIRVALIPIYAAYLYLHMRRNLPYTSFSPLRQPGSSEPIYQASEVEQVHYAE